MPRPNPVRQQVRAAVRQVQTNRPALEQNTQPVDANGAISSGHVDATTYEWHAAGISGITSTADPFYSGG